MRTRPRAWRRSSSGTRSTTRRTRPTCGASPPSATTWSAARFSRTNPYVIAEDVAIETVEIVSERASDMPGVETQVGQTRYYGDDGALAPHVVGTLGAISEEQYAEAEAAGNTYSASNVSGYFLYGYGRAERHRVGFRIDAARAKRQGDHRDRFDRRGRLHDRDGPAAGRRFRLAHDRQRPAARRQRDARREDLVRAAGGLRGGRGGSRST